MFSVLLMKYNSKTKLYAGALGLPKVFADENSKEIDDYIAEQMYYGVSAKEFCNRRRNNGYYIVARMIEV